MRLSNALAFCALWSCVFASCSGAADPPAVCSDAFCSGAFCSPAFEQEDRPAPMMRTNAAADAKPVLDLFWIMVIAQDPLQLLANDRCLRSDLERGTALR